MGTIQLKKQNKNLVLKGMARVDTGKPWWTGRRAWSRAQDDAGGDLWSMKSRQQHAPGNTPQGWQQWQLHESRNHIPWFSPSSFWQTEFFAVCLFCFVCFFKPPPSLAVLLVQAVSMWSHSEEIWFQRQRECCLPDLEISFSARSQV